VAKRLNFWSIDRQIDRRGMMLESVDESWKSSRFRLIRTPSAYRVLSTSAGVGAAGGVAGCGALSPSPSATAAAQKPKTTAKPSAQKFFIAHTPNVCGNLKRMITIP